MTVVRDDASLIGEGYLKESHLKQHLCCYFDLTKFNLGKQDGVDVVFLCAFTIFHVPLTGMARNTWAAPSCNPQFRFQTQLRSAHMLMSWWNTLKSSMSYYVILCHTMSYYVHYVHDSMPLSSIALTFFFLSAGMTLWTMRLRMVGLARLNVNENFIAQKGHEKSNQTAQRAVLCFWQCVTERYHMLSHCKPGFSLG